MLHTEHCKGALRIASHRRNSLKITLSLELLVLLMLLVPISWNVHDECADKRSPRTGQRHCEPQDFYGKAGVLMYLCVTSLTLLLYNQHQL